MTAKKSTPVKETVPTEKIVKAAEKSLLNKLEDHKEVVETITEVWKDANGNVTKQHESVKEKLVKADLNAIIFALKAHSGEKWNFDEKELNKAKLEKLRAEAGSLNDPAALTLSEKLSSYTGIGPEQLKFS